MRWLFLLLALGACSPAPFAGLVMGPRRAKYRERILVQTLSNGLRVMMLPDERTNLVMVGVRYAVGASDDPSNGEGLAHYVEHVMFEAGYRGPTGNALRDVGLDQNASTTFDRTFFYLKALDVDLDSALEIAARRFETACDDLDPATLARERDVVIAEEKWRTPKRQIAGGLLRAIWGADHPYGRNPGGHGFADLPREAVCKFIEDHYGPASAVLVVAGSVRDADFQRIRRRFERIAPRPAANRAAHTPTIRTSRVVIDDLLRPVALVVFPAPGEGSAFDAALDALDGRVWRLDGDAPATHAQTFVVGGERERAIVAVAEVADAKRLDELAAAVRRTLAKATIAPEEFEAYKERRRAVLAAQLDDTFETVEPLAAAIARGERPTRFRELQQLERLTSADLTRWFDPATVRTAFLLPQVGVHGTLRVSEIETSLHDVDVPRSPVSGMQPPLPPTARKQLAIVEYQLRNGLRVILVPDSNAIAMDARIVIQGTRDESASDLDLQAAMFLTANAGELPAPSVIERLRFYKTIGASVIGYSNGDSTTFRIRGLSVWADWHLWNLAWTVLDGTYRAELLAKFRNRQRLLKPEPPTAERVVARRMVGLGGTPDAKWTIHASSSLEAFRHARYRPERSTLIVVGNFEVDVMRKEIETLFNEWERRHELTIDGTPAPPRVGGAIGIPSNDQPTVEITIAFPPATKLDATKNVALDVLKDLIGRRMRVVRDQLGASYGVRVSDRRDAIWISGAVETAYAAEAAKAIADELERIRAGDASVLDDFVRARKHVLATALAMPLGASNIATGLEDIVCESGEPKQLDRRIEAIRTLDFAAVQRIVELDMSAKRMIVAVRGKRDAVEAAIHGFGIPREDIEWITAER